MNRIFADTFYWVALFNARDQDSERVHSIGPKLASVRLVTTDEVLTETLNYFSDFGTYLRNKAVADVRDILLHPNIEVISCRHEAVLDGIELYEQRPDKGYSLTDCISMNICRERGISEILTHDDHFAQEGFTILL